MAIQTYTGTLTVIECYQCGIAFGFPRFYENERRGDHAWFYCPNGHKQRYPQRSEAEKLRDDLAFEKRRIGWLTSDRDQARAEADHQAARANGYKGALTKTKKRISKGVCPNCNRHFADVERHMATKHPLPDAMKGGGK